MHPGIAYVPVALPYQVPPPVYPNREEEETIQRQMMLDTQQAHQPHRVRRQRNRTAAADVQAAIVQRREAEALQRREAQMVQHNIRLAPLAQRAQEEQDARDHQAIHDAENAIRHQMQAEAIQEANFAVPLGCQPYREPVQKHTLGSMNVECVHCHALHFDSEKLSKSRSNSPLFGQCCLQGKVQIPPVPEPPATLKNLLHGLSPLSGSFRKNIRQYNNAFAFTSVGVKIDNSVTRGTGPYCFKISGELHHSMGTLMPPGDHAPQFAQLYIYDPAEQANLRHHNNQNLDPQLIGEIQAMLHELNPYVPLYKQAFMVMREKPAEEHDRIVVRLHLDKDVDRRHYNLPTVEEIAAVIPGDGAEERSEHRDVVL
jgi:hypothetical protein